MPSRRDPSELCTVVLWLKHASRCVLAPCALGTVERLAFPASRLHRHSQMRRPLPHPCCEADRAAIHPDGACREHWVIMRVTPPRRGRVPARRSRCTRGTEASGNTGGTLTSGSEAVTHLLRCRGPPCLRCSCGCARGRLLARQVPASVHAHDACTFVAAPSRGVK